MFPSGQTGSGINSSFGLVPISGQSSSGSADGTRNLAFNWLGHLTGRGVGLFDEPASGLKTSSDQIMDQSFMSIDRHTPTVPRRTPHSSVGGNGSQPGTDATQPPHPIQDPSMVNAFHPYRLVGDGIVPSGHSSLSTSQFAAFDSLYKAYQGAYGSTAPGGVFGTQPFRFDNPLLADQRMMLQASLLQYPHLGIFPNAALYPGIPGTGVRYPNDYYGQNLSGMPLSSKYPDVGGTTWLGFDRPMSLLDREKDTKDGDRKCDLDLSKRSDKDEHHRDRPERVESLSLRREPKEDGRRYEDGRKDTMKHASEKKDQQKRSNSLRSPIRLEGHQPPMQDCGSNRCNSGGPSDFSYSSGRSGHAVPTFGLSTDLSGLTKVSSSPGTVTSHQRQSTSRSDRSIDSVQDHARTKDRHHHHHHHPHHHNWKPEDVKSKATPLVLTVPKTTASASTNGQQLKPFEKKFHRPFEQAQTNSVPADRLECLPAHGPRDAAAKNSRGVDASLDYVARSTDAKVGDGYRLLQQQQPLRAAGGGIGKLFEPTSQLHAAAIKKQGSGGGGMRCEEVPLNLVVTKSRNSGCGTVAPANPVTVEPFSNEDYEFPRLHRGVPVHPSVPPPIPNSEPGFLGPASWGLLSSDEVCLPPLKSTEGLSGGSVAPTVATRGTVAQQPVSKLDLEAKRRARMRKNSSISEDEEDDEDEDLLDNSKDLARLLLISSGPPLKQPVAQSKSSFLAMFGLMSLDSSKEAAFERRQKRRRLFGEQSISPVQFEESGEPEYSKKKPSFQKEIAPLDKHSFLGLFNLESARPHAKKRKVTSSSDGIDANKCCREPPLYRSKHSGVVNTLISGNGEQTWSTVDPDCQSSSCDTKCCDVRSRPGGNSSVIRTQDDHRQPNTGFSISSSAGDGGRFAKEGPPDSLPFNISSRNASTPSAAREAANDQAPAAAAAADLQSSEQTFHWPGLEAVIESYHHYIEEQTMEKQLLREQSQHLRHNNSQLMVTAERLRARMSELFYSKQQLLEERLKTQSLVDGLKDAVKHLI